MLKPKALAQVLSQANTGGVLSTLLVTKEGSFLAYAGETTIQPNITAAMAANLWACYEKNGLETFREETMNFLLLDCERGILAVTRVGTLFLCMHAKEGTPIGLIKLKLERIANHIEAPMAQLLSGS